MLSESQIIKLWRNESKRRECNQKNQANLTSKRSNFQPLRAYQINLQPLSLREILSKIQFYLNKIDGSNKELNNRKKNNNKKSKCNKLSFYKRKKKGNRSSKIKCKYRGNNSRRKSWGSNRLISSSYSNNCNSSSYNSRLRCSSKLKCKVSLLCANNPTNKAIMVINTRKGLVSPQVGKTKIYQAKIAKDFATLQRTLQSWSLAVVLIKNARSSDWTTF